MVEVLKEKGKIKVNSQAKAFKSSVVLGSHEYREILENQAAYQKLYKYLFLEDVSDLYLLSDLVGCRDASQVVSLKRNLEGYLRSIYGGSFDRKVVAEEVCPICFQISLTAFARGGEEIKKTCTICGAELEDSFGDFNDFSQNLDRDVTYAPTSHISYSGGKGCTFNPNSDREHKNLLWNIVNANNVLFSKFKEEKPEIAVEFEDGVFEVWDGKFIYCRVDSFVRRAPIDEYFNCVNAFWHQFDAPLQKAKLSLMIDVKSSFRRSKEYGLKLCEKYGFNNKDRDQAIYNTVGLLIERLKPFVDARERHVSEKVFTETVFYICLLRFDRRRLAPQVKSDLEIDVDLVNFFDDIMAVLEKYDQKANFDPSLLNALEASNGSRAI
jgi:hypothetical protein